ncbi:MAG TPA: GxxExxY protein [Chthoniobacterales bacterium]
MTQFEAERHILDAALVIHNKLGPGLHHTLYEIVLTHELSKRGVPVQRDHPIAIRYDGYIFDDAFRAELVVAYAIIVELKSVETLSPVHSQRLLSQLKMSGLKLGLLINFGEASLTNGIHRVVNGGLEEAVGF